MSASTEDEILKAIRKRCPGRVVEIRDGDPDTTEFAPRRRIYVDGVRRFSVSYDLLDHQPGPIRDRLVESLADAVFMNIST